MYRCEKHGGHGFVSDCEICNVEKMLTERDERIKELTAERDAVADRLDALAVRFGPYSPWGQELLAIAAELREGEG